MEQKVGRILVTGATGFIGVNLCRKLLDEGHDILAVDNFYSSPKTNLEILKSYAETAPGIFEFEEHDVCHMFVGERWKCSRIFHLACPASPPRYQKDSLYTLDTCYQGTRNVLELAKQNNARVLIASTSEIYGDPLVHPQEETYRGNVNTMGPRSCYDEGKRAGETLGYLYQNMFGVEIRMARIFNTYGPFMDPDDGRVVSNLVTQAIKGQNLSIYGDGTQTRSFCYVEDLVRGLRALMESSVECDPVNLGNPGEFQILEFAKMVIQMKKEKSGTELELGFQPLPQDDPLQRQPVITKAKEKLNWVPEIPLQQGLEKTWDYFAELLSKES